VGKLAATRRFAGSADEVATQNLCVAILEDLGFAVTRQPFQFSEAPGRWGPSLVALLAAAIVWLAAHVATRHHAPFTGLLTDIAGLTALSLLGYWFARFGVLSIGLSRSSSANLVATRSAFESAPEIWLVAHSDSKSQTIPMIARVAAAVAFAIVSATVLLGIVLIAVLGQNAVLSTATTAMSYLAVATALPIILCFVGNNSRGAVDNASGVATIILAAGKLGRGRNIGVLITSAEELGLAGARYFVATRSERGVAINCDTVDDSGRFLCMTSGRKSRRLDNAIHAASSRLQLEGNEIPSKSGSSGLRLRGMIPGILADNVAFSDAGWQSFTLSRGNLATLGYVHTSGDLPVRIQGTGIAMAASLIAATVEELS
jgi:peptidase M28-like protein